MPAIGKEYEGMKKIKVLQQVLNPSGSGGVSAEFRSLSHSSLRDKYEFIPMILIDYHRGFSFKDIVFYYRRIKEISPDIIHIRGAAIDGLNAVVAAKIAHKGKILVTVHGMYSDLVFIGPFKRFISKHIIEKLIFSFADGISCVCKAAQQRSYFNPYRKKMLPYVYNRMPSFDLSLRDKYRNEVREEYNIPLNAVVCLYVGRITREKGMDILVKALKLCERNLSNDFVMMVVGDGCYLETMKKMVGDSSIRYEFTGDRRDVERYYHTADFFIQPSLHENHSIALLESCAAELPMIASNCGGNAEIVTDGKTGILVSVADSQALSDAIEKMCNEMFRKECCSNIQIDSFERFSDDYVDERLDAVYTKLMG